MKTMSNTEWARLSDDAREKIASELANWVTFATQREDSLFADLYLQHATRVLARRAEALLEASVVTASLKFRWDAAPPRYVAADITADRLDLQLDVPRYLHDCDECTFLGQFEGEDLYSCEKGPIPTFIARYGSEGREYRSGAAFVGVDQAITEAAKRKDGR